MKTTSGWVGKHTLILQEKLGRKLVPGERAIFKDGNKANLDPSNIVLSEAMGTRSLQARIAKLEAEIADRQALVSDLKKELESRTSDE